jgi:hypothetical protein
MTDSTEHLPRVAKGRRASFHDDPGVDQLFGIVTALASELWVARERIDTLERLLEASGVLAAGAVEGFRPDGADATARTAEREAFIRRVFQVLEDYA